MTPTVHTFESSSEAYDASQWNDEIKNGDVLRVPAEGIVGILIEAWPVAIVHQGDTGAFHVIGDDAAGEALRSEYAESILAAKEASVVTVDEIRAESGQPKGACPICGSEAFDEYACEDCGLEIEM